MNDHMFCTCAQCSGVAPAITWDMVGLTSNGTNFSLFTKPRYKIHADGSWSLIPFFKFNEPKPELL